MKIITDDDLVDMSFGTGAVKITPAHDPKDYNCGKKNNLEFISILNDDGTMNGSAGEFEGMPRYQVRKLITQKLKDLELFRGQRGNPMVLTICNITKDVLEPMVKPQWYLSTQQIKNRLLEVVESGELDIQPTHH